MWSWRLLASTLIAATTESQTDVTSTTCLWVCPVEDHNIWHEVQLLDYLGSDVPKLWLALRERTQHLKHSLEACHPGALIVQLWALLAQSHSLPGTPRRPLRDAAQGQIYAAGCSPFTALCIRALREGTRSPPCVVRQLLPLR